MGQNHNSPGHAACHRAEGSTRDHSSGPGLRFTTTPTEAGRTFNAFERRGHRRCPRSWSEPIGIRNCLRLSFVLRLLTSVKHLVLTPFTRSISLQNHHSDRELPGSSREIQWTRCSGTTKATGFKVDEKLATFLDSLPRKREFIRRAILEQFVMICPLCTGSSVVMRGVREHSTPTVNINNETVCQMCEMAEMLPIDLSSLPAADRRRWEKFFRGGGHCCRSCYATAPSCRDCGWHLPTELVHEHYRRADGN